MDFAELNDLLGMVSIPAELAQTAHSLLSTVNALAKRKESENAIAVVLTDTSKSEAEKLAWLQEFVEKENAVNSTMPLPPVKSPSSEASCDDKCEALTAWTKQLAESREKHLQNAAKLNSVVFLAAAVIELKGFHTSYTKFTGTDTKFGINKDALKVHLDSLAELIVDICKLVPRSGAVSVEIHQAFIPLYEAAKSEVRYIEDLKVCLEDHQVTLREIAWEGARSAMLSAANGGFGLFQARQTGFRSWGLVLGVLSALRLVTAASNAGIAASAWMKIKEIQGLVSNIRQNVEKFRALERRLHHLCRVSGG
jgi:hypothetical protein